MARPVDTEYRTAILGAFDRHTIRSLGEVNNYLKEVGEHKSYQSTRRTLDKLCEEKLLTKLPRRGDKNAALYSKLVFNQSAKFVNRAGYVVTTKEFLDELISTKFPPVVEEQAALVIKHWILDSLGSAYPEGYTGKRDYPEEEKLKRRLEGTLKMLRDMHGYIKGFLDSGAYTSVAREILAAEFKNELAPYHVSIVEENWHSDTD